MPITTPPRAAADEGLDRVDRGQRVAGEATLGKGHDGKERALFARPKQVGQLPADLADPEQPAPVTVEDVVEVAPSASAWEALEDGDEG